MIWAKAGNYRGVNQLSQFQSRTLWDIFSYKEESWQFDNYRMKLPQKFFEIFINMIEPFFCNKRMFSVGILHSGLFTVCQKMLKSHPRAKIIHLDFKIYLQIKHALCWLVHCGFTFLVRVGERAWFPFSIGCCMSLNVLLIISCNYPIL